MLCEDFIMNQGYDRKELEELADRFGELAHGDINLDWKVAYLELAKAAATLAAMVKNCEIPTE